jgi:ABC-type Fe3+ transport system substrate-binding protein
MKLNFHAVAAFSISLCVCAIGTHVLAAMVPDPSLARIQKESEARGYTFFAEREQIVAGAKREGKLRVLSALDAFQELRKAFLQQYPFVDLQVEDVKGTDAPQKFILELKAGAAASQWDVFDVAPELFQEFLPYIKKVDILGMANHRVLQIPAEMVDPKNRDVVSVASALHVLAYNKNLLSADRVPKMWEDFLRAEFKGKTFMVDLRPLGFAAMAAGLGEEWMMNYARKIKDQEPIWIRGQTRSVTAIAAGEQSLLHLAYYNACMKAKLKDVSKSLECKIIEPVPVRIGDMIAINSTTPHPHASLLWLEFQASPRGQSIIDRFFNSSIYAPGSEAAKIVGGKKVSVNDWKTFHSTEKWMEMTLKTFGFPKADAMRQ